MRRTIMEQGDRWLQQRAEYRQQNRQLLRRRENLPEHDGERYAVGEKRVGLAVGQRRGIGAGRSLAEGFLAAALDTGFDLYVTDLPDLVRELSDLDRDAENFAFSEAVRFEDVPQGPTMADVILESHVRSNHIGVVPDSVDDEALDRWMQEELRRRVER